MAVFSFLFALDRVRLATVAIFLGTLTLGCSVRGSGVLETETREFEYYDAISLGDGFVGRVEFGSAYSVEVEADDNLIDNVRMKVVSGRLFVDLDGLSTKNATLRAKFTVPELRAADVHDGSILEVEEVPLSESFDLELSGGSIGRVTMLPGERLDTLLIENSGGGSFRASANSATTLVDISGGGSGTIVGSTEALTTSLSGGSHLDAQGLLTRFLSFDLSGGSSAEVQVQEEARGELSGGSVLEVQGEADIDADTSGGSTVDRR